MAIDEATLAAWVVDARRRTIALHADLGDAELAVPYLRIINPPVWELGHVAWFQEHWILRHVLGQPPIHDGADALWNSAVIPHARRWTAALPSRAATLEYLEVVRDRVLAALSAGDAGAKLRYFTLLSIFHEDMHGEAFAYTRQTLGWPPPRLFEAVRDVDELPAGQQGSGLRRLAERASRRARPRALAPRGCVTLQDTAELSGLSYPEVHRRVTSGQVPGAVQANDGTRSIPGRPRALARVSADDDRDVQINRARRVQILLPDLGDRSDQPPPLVRVVDPQVAVPPARDGLSHDSGRISRHGNRLRTEAGA